MQSIEGKVAWVTGAGTESVARVRSRSSEPVQRSFYGTTGAAVG